MSLLFFLMLFSSRYIWKGKVDINSPGEYQETMWLELVFKPWYSERRLGFWFVCLLACIFWVILGSSFLAVSTNRRAIIGETSLLDLKLTCTGLHFIRQTYKHTRSFSHVASSDCKSSSSWKEKEDIEIIPFSGWPVLMRSRKLGTMPTNRQRNPATCRLF